MIGMPRVSAERGSIMIEILVTIVICVIGLWGLTEVQARLQLSEMESYQRSQAVMLLEDMATRVELNRGVAASYVTASELGAGMTCPTVTNASALVDRDKAAWCEALQGAAETSGTSKVGAMLGARGCVESIGADQYMITVAWQGTAPISAPPSSVTCGEDDYDESGTACVNDLCRRAITTIVRIGDLSI